MPTVYALIPDNAHFLDAQGNPANGAKLFIYTAGSSTKATTYTESDGAVANSNPIVLDSRGEMPSGCYVTSGTYKTILAPSTDTDPPTSPYRTRDNLSPVNDTSTTVNEFAASGLTPTFVSSTQLTLVGDQRTEFHVGRRLKTSNSGGTGYHTITASAYTSLTTVTVSNDSVVLDAGLSSVDLSILSADNSAMPHLSSDSTGLTATGDFEVDGALILAQGAGVASAAALAVDIAGNAFDVTVGGVTVITSINTKGVGTHITLQFDGALTLTHHATDLILPGGANITTAAGDVAVFYEYATGDWRCVSYSRADGRALVGNESPETTVNTTSGTSVELSTTIPSDAKSISLIFNSVSTNGTSHKIIQLGDASSYETSGYVGAGVLLSNGSAITATAFTAGFGVRSSDATDELTGIIELRNPSGNIWVASGSVGTVAGTDAVITTHGVKTVTGTLTRIRINTVGGTDTFDNGSITVAYER